MSVKKPVFTITFGGWYQRTTLHLSEIYDLFANGYSHLPLSTSKIKSLSEGLDLVSVSREIGELEYVKAITKDNIEIRYYEDGLYVLEITTANISTAQIKLQGYYDNFLSPAISYIFSLGAPTPKILADVKTTHPVVVSTNYPHTKAVLSAYDFGPVYSQIVSASISVFKTPQYIIVVDPLPANHTRDLIEMQIFFREFKDQLQRYLNIHRHIWEEISEVKEKGQISGHQVEPMRSRLDSYQKTINLINSRISQMGSYVNTRASIARKLKIEDQLLSIFQYKFETLTDTHVYIKEIWKMTDAYVNTAIQVLTEVKNQSTANGIQSLRLITTIGVLSGIIGYLSKDTFPKITPIGLWYFVILVLGTWLINQIINLIYKKIKYQLKFADKVSLKP